MAEAGVGGGDREHARLWARRWQVSVTEAAAWLDADPAGAVRRHVVGLRAAGITPSEVADVLAELPPHVAARANTMADSMVLAGIDLATLPVWLRAAHRHGWFAGDQSIPARGGHPGGRGTAGARRSGPRSWVTQARRYLAATGDAESAALCAAAGVSVQEAEAYRECGEAGLAELRMMVALTEL